MQQVQIQEYHEMHRLVMPIERYLESSCRAAWPATKQLLLHHLLRDKSK
jgi:hypothetical protein